MKLQRKVLGLRTRIKYLTVMEARKEIPKEWVIPWPPWVRLRRRSPRNAAQVRNAVIDCVRGLYES